MQQAPSNTSTGSKRVELEMRINEDGATPEDYRLRDVTRWQFRRTSEASDISYIYVENGSLYAYATTRREVPPNPAPINNPLVLNTAGHFIPVRAAPPPKEFTYGRPYQRLHVRMNDFTAVGQYVVAVHIEAEGGGEYLLHVDNCSDYSWICGFDRGPGFAKYISEHTRIPTYRFRAECVDGGCVSGVVCKALASFDESTIRFDHGWTFGVAEEANERFVKNRASDGILALSFMRPSSFPDYDNQTFMEYLTQHGYIRDCFFTVKIRRNERSTITFGKPPELEGPQFYFQKVVDSRWALPSPELCLSIDGYTLREELTTRDTRLNAAIFDTGATYIYMQPEIVHMIYTKLCGQDNFFGAKGSYYVKAEVLGKQVFRHATIRFTFGNIRLFLPAKSIIGEYSHEFKAYIGTFQAKGQGSCIDNSRWTYDIYGTYFFKYVWIVFSAGLADPKIAIRQSW